VAESTQVGISQPACQCQHNRSNGQELEPVQQIASGDTHEVIGCSCGSQDTIRNLERRLSIATREARASEEQAVESELALHRTGEQTE
jgi:hypothetical protein